MPEEKKHYSTHLLLNDKDLQIFNNFIKEFNITCPEMALIEGSGITSSAINARIRKGRVKKDFANKVVDIKKKELEDRLKTFDKLIF